MLSAIRGVGTSTIHPAKPGDLPAILDLVRAVNLPPEGIAEALEYFWVAREGDRIIGSVGLEVYDDLALLRSLAVQPEWQGLSLGRALTETALSYVTRRQFRAIYLRTTTAAACFRRYDFHPVPPADVPVSVQQSLEFRSA
jgi:amino-acid N-acetyltransferase